ncbi:MAG: hydrogenase maturation nickel metallochaperone HypA [Ignavibacteria bacterium]|nr:hydrogenase maturation nickel metallochaperone HypA [Ignavibacteria bacterium]
MHELSIAQEIINIIEQYVSDEDSDASKSVKIKIGKLSNILPDSLTFCYDALIKGTKLENSKLEIENIPIKVECQVCSETFEVDDYVFLCIKCQSNNLKILSGNEFQISEILIDN